MGFVNPFAAVYVPILWAHELAMFGCVVDYLPEREEPGQQVEGVWKEGAEGEGFSPGRYSIFWIATDATPEKPRRGDAVQKDGLIYDVVDVQTTATGHSRLVLQENMNG